MSMANKNFKVKNSLEVGNRDIITPDGTITIPSGTHNLAPLDSPAFTGTVDFTGASLNGVDSLPSQTGNNGKYLTTNGSSASWSIVDALPSQSGNSGKYLTTNGTSASWSTIASGANSVTVGTTTTLSSGSSATVTNSGTSTDLILDFGIPQGVQGNQGVAGPANTLTIGTVTNGGSASATITGTSPNQTLNLTLPQGPAATIAVGTVTTVSSTTPAAITNSGSSSAAVFDFSIPQGATGPAGATGPQGPQGDPGPMTFLLMCI